jgi:hypothetical protein
MSPSRPRPPTTGRPGWPTTTRRAFLGGSLAAVLAAAIGIRGGVRGQPMKRPPLWIGHL